MRPDTSSLQVSSEALLSLFSQVRGLPPEAAARMAARCIPGPRPCMATDPARPIDHLPIPHSCQVALRRMGVQTVGELSAQTEARLLSRHGLGRHKVSLRGAAAASE